MRSFIFIISLFLISIGVFAQEAANEAYPVGGDWQAIVGWIAAIAIPALWEVFIRFYPTAKNWSIASWVLKALLFVPQVLAAIFPNKNKSGGVHQ